MSMLKEFKEFALKGNVVDLAVGVIIGGAFGKIVTSIVNDILMPPIGKIMGGVNFNDLFINLDPTKRLPNGDPITSLAKAKEAGAAVIAQCTVPKPIGTMHRAFLWVTGLAAVVFLFLDVLWMIRARREV